jgi:mannose/fructose-specific phosphotransferase system component IIA
MVTGIVVTHGNLAEALIRTAHTVYGKFSDCHALSNASRSPNALIKEIENVIKAVRGRPCMIFVDFLGGSCSHACLMQASTRGNAQEIPIVSGVNLPMLLAFLNKRDEVPFDQLADAIVERSHNSIQVLDPSKI